LRYLETMGFYKFAIFLDESHILMMLFLV